MREDSQAMEMLRAVLWILSGLALMALAAGFFGALHPMGDSLAVVRLPLAAALCLAALVLALAGTRRALWLAAPALAAVALSLPVFQGAGASAAAQATVYQKNLSFRLQDRAPIIADIRAAAPDILTLQEVTAANRQILAELTQSLPTQHFCRFARVGGVAVASRWPAIPGTAGCAENIGMAVLQVQAPTGPLWLVSLHLHWPWPHGQAAQVDRMLPALQALDGPVIVGGDFNMMPWGHSVRSIAQAVGSPRRGGFYSSFARFAPWLALPIDHVLAPGAATVRLRPELGSDHRGLLAEVTLPGR